MCRHKKEAVKHEGNVLLLLNNGKAHGLSGLSKKPFLPHFKPSQAGDEGPFPGRVFSSVHRMLPGDEILKSAPASKVRAAAAQQRLAVREYKEVWRDVKCFAVERPHGSDPGTRRPRSSSSHRGWS